MSVMFIQSAQAYDGGNEWKKQIVWSLLGFILYFTVAILDYRIFLKYAHIVYGISILSLLLVFGGPKIYGASRWVDLGFFKIQPSEMAKFATLVMGASILSRSKIGDLRDSLNGILRLTLCFILPMFLIFLQPDLGSTMVLPPIAFTLLYVARIPAKFFVATAMLFMLLLGLLGLDIYRYYQHKSENLRNSEPVVAYEENALLPLKDYQRKRILTFIAPEVVDPHGIGPNWNRIQALIAVSTGGISGKGWGEGMQAKLGYLPPAVAHNDFIFAVLAEEWGLIGSIFALLAYAVVIFGCLKVASKSADMFGRLLASSVAILLMVHLFINVGMTLGITPITGLPLPFMSYGGSFIITCFLMMGVVQSIHRHRKEFIS
ncbi:MAG: cell cycle protein [Opitutae bacterium]|nr:cell cycle protein [Opitutae bacterium]HAD21257.1 cell cycle protein [Opitutae bacterium]